jgi:hypothetical protein
MRWSTWSWRLCFWRPFKFLVWLEIRLLGGMTYDEHLRLRRTSDKAMGRKVHKPGPSRTRRRAQRRAEWR